MWIITLLKSFPLFYSKALYCMLTVTIFFLLVPSAEISWVTLGIPSNPKGSEGACPEMFFPQEGLWDRIETWRVGGSTKASWRSLGGQSGSALWVLPAFRSMPQRPSLPTCHVHFQCNTPQSGLWLPSLETCFSTEALRGVNATTSIFTRNICFLFHSGFPLSTYVIKWCRLPFRCFWKHSQCWHLLARHLRNGHVAGL